MTGSIEKRGKNSYRLVVFKGYDLDGRPIRHQKTIHCKKKSEAQIKLAKFLTEVESGLIVDGNIPTFAQYEEIWAKDYALKELAPSTYYRYKRMLETRITPYFGHYKLNKIKPTDIMRFYDLLEDDTQIVRRKNNNGKKTRKPLSQKTILEHHRLLSAMLHKAVYWNGIININKSSQYLSEKGVFTKSPKTESSIRDVAIPDFIVSLLEEYKLWYDEQKSIVGDFWHESNRLFVQDDGKPIHPSTISKWVEQFVKKIGLPVINFHGLRHTNASLLVAQNVDIAVISARLGHAQISTTLDFYVHPLLSHNRKAGYALENLLLPTRS